LKPQSSGSSSTSTPASDVRESGMTGVLAVIYLLFGSSLLIAVATHGSIQGIELEWPDAWLPALIVVAGIGILRRTHWGRWLGYIVSVPLLFGVPIGTILGGYMIWQLTRHRAAFTRIY
jgi:hypothetical protein